MIFVDGENLTLRFQAMRDAGRQPLPLVRHETDVYVWNPDLSWFHGLAGDVTRVYYYTSVIGDDDRVSSVRRDLASLRLANSAKIAGQLYPQVFKKARRSQKSRLVDINIVIDVMRHAYMNDVDQVLLVSGDGDYLDLLRDVGRRGKRVAVAALTSGLHKDIKSHVDHFRCLDGFLFGSQQKE